jgi:hypothetical protein
MVSTMWLMSFCGPVSFSDCQFTEPTAGLDPYNRRTIWDMIIAAKKDRSIILTTVSLCILCCFAALHPTQQKSH